MRSPSQPDPTEPMMLNRPMTAMVQAPTSAGRPRSTRYAGRWTVMKNNWNPQVK